MNGVKPSGRWRESIHLSIRVLSLVWNLLLLALPLLLILPPRLILRRGNFPLLVSHLLEFLLDAEIVFSRSLEQVEVRVTAITNPLLNFYPCHARPMKASAANICRALNLGQLNAAVVAEGSAWHRHGSLLGLRGELACGREQKNVCIIKIIKTLIFMTSQAAQLLRGERSRSSKTKSF